MRIQKYLSQQGIASRREAERWMESRWILLNGQVVTELGTQMDPDVDVVTVRKPDSVAAVTRSIIAFHKPPGIVTNCPQGDETEIRDLLPPQYQSFNSIGRLDKDSEGLILLTNDGIVSQRLLDPKRPHERVYEVTVNKTLTPDNIATLESGMPLLGKITKPLTLRVLAPFVIELTMTEGKNRQIRRMIQKVGSGVLILKRISFGPIRLGELRSGQWRELSEPEITMVVGK